MQSLQVKASTLSAIAALAFCSAQVSAQENPGQQNFSGQNLIGRPEFGMPANRAKGQYQTFPPDYAHTLQPDTKMREQNSPQQNRVQENKLSPQQAARVFQWFLSYDEIRRRAQMNPIEKQQADGMLARGLGLIMPGHEKMQAKQMLGSLVIRYQTACQSLQQLQQLAETSRLQQAYFQYFSSAAELFSDYLKVQDNVFAVDRNGQSIAKRLMQRKGELENLEHSCKELDFILRQNYGVPQYQY